MTALVLRGATLADGRVVDVVLRGDRIAAVTEPGADAADGVPLDLTGYLLTPSLVEPHAHLDKALTAGVVPNPTYDLPGAITAWLAHRPNLTRDDIVHRAEVAARTYLANGVTTIRTHTDVGDGVGLRALEALLELRDQLRDACTLQVVAFVGEPLTGVAGAGNRALLADALAAGADVAGGCPYRAEDPKASVATCLAIAADHGAPVDLHTDETLDPDVLTLGDFADLVTTTGFRYGATASHCVSLGVQPPDVAREVAERVAAAGIAVVCAPQTNLYLQGRGQVAAPRGLTALRALRDAGVTVAAGGDNLQDPFNCVGRGDPLETAALLVLAGHETPDAAFAAVTSAARAALGVPDVTVAAGAPADLLAIRAVTVPHAVATASAGRIVVHRGRVVARTTLTSEFPMGART